LKSALWICRQFYASPVGIVEISLKSCVGLPAIDARKDFRDMANSAAIADSVI
jgi:hypothetical protein